jgi:hypothetical protein
MKVGTCRTAANAEGYIIWERSAFGSIHPIEILSPEFRLSDCERSAAVPAPGMVAMWKLETRKQHVKIESIGREWWLDRETLVNDDGVTVMAAGGGPEHLLHFIYSDGDLSFDFLATRFSGASEQPTDTWTVLLDAALNSLENMQRISITPDQAREIADTIADGMLAWPIPLHAELEAVPAKAVKFLIKTWQHWSPTLGWGE